jgi:hypothetical protein
LKEPSKKKLENAMNNPRLDYFDLKDNIETTERIFIGSMG